jgi:peptide/nickel transport system substrate-binding protein
VIFNKLLSAAVVAALLIVPTSLGLAQEDEGFGSGGPIIAPNTGTDISTFNPLYYGDGATGVIVGLMYPSIIGINPQTGLEEPNQDGAMATAWEFNEAGDVVTITLREDMFWSDGTPITANDYLYSVTAVRSGQVDSPRESMFATLADGSPAGGEIADIVALDDYTVQVTFTGPDCVAFSDINNVSVVPRAEFEAAYGDDYAAMLDDPLRVPEVVFGPFGDPEFTPGSQVSLLPMENYTDNEPGYVVPNEYIYLSIPDTTVAVERFLAGDLTYLAVPGPRQDEIEANPDVQSYRFIGNSFNFFAFNSADPENPQPGLDANGDSIDQGLHPIFGDVRVRQALAQAFDKDTLIEGIIDGKGVPVATHTTPNSWVYDEGIAYTYDPDAASELLAQAGWVDDDNDPTTPLICDGCLYAEEVDPDFAGSPLTFTLLSGSGSETGEELGLFFDAEMAKIGVEVDFQQVDFNSVLVPNMLGQTYDMVLLAWSLAYPVDPDVTSFYGPASDQPGSGFNFVSFNNERLNELMAEARTVPGCDQDARAELYAEAQQILFEEMPYIYLYVPSSLTAVQTNVGGFNPTPVSRVWNQDTWFIPPQ